MPDASHGLERFVRAQERTCETALAVDGRTAHEIFGSPDDLKFRSCATLFARVTSPGSVFQRALDKDFGGEGDPRTLELVDW